MTNTASRLRGIKTFEKLVQYLEEELDWPLEEYSFEDLTFEYLPAELGLKEEEAAKVKTIHQLRPLRQDQPWGIFFVEFERKRMPVVVLRRVLSHLVVKKRAAPHQVQMAAWHLDDLLFISAFGDEVSDQREIAFAHFHQETGDLPTLRVLGWDGADTPLKLDHVAATLKERLRWPSDPGDADAWRQQWSPAFRHRLGHVIRTADALAERLALLARGIRDAATTLMDHESERGPLRRLHKAFQTALIHDLSEADFADTYAQTITYGLLTAAIQRTDLQGGRYDTTLYSDMLAEVVPITNPFLKEMLQTFLQAGGRQGGINFDELGIQDVVELLRGDETDLPAILRDFGNRTRGEDPVMHFYEHFLAAYDKRLKVQRGIFYTPQPVVSYIVRSVHELLQTEFGLEDGLASTITWGEMAQRHPGLEIPDGTDPRSPFVVILDPATGTATFLVEVIDVIHRTLTARWQQQRLSEEQQRAAWNDYVPQHLLPRLYGYELMMAPYAIAHMKIGLKLYETGYRFGSDERVRVYLTNALEPASDEEAQLPFAEWAPALALEAQAVNAIKRQQRFTVIVGNPPYSEKSKNEGAWINGLMERYKTTIRSEEAQIKAVSNDYVKFLCLCHHLAEQSGKAIVGLITSNGYLDGRLFRDLRRSWLSSFERIYILNLHGSGRRGDAATDDQNVFDILQGVSVAIAERAFPKLLGEVRYGEMLGPRTHKYQRLLGESLSVCDIQLTLREPLFLFTPSNSGQSALPTWPLSAIFGTGNPSKDRNKTYAGGFKTRQDGFTVAFDEQTLRSRIFDLADSSIPELVLREKYGLCSTAHFEFSKARRAAQTGDLARAIRLVRYRPFDDRPMIWAREVLCEPQIEVTRHLLQSNLCLATSRVVKDDAFRHVAVARGPVEVISLSNSTSTNAYMFPLYRYENDQLLGREGKAESRIPNLSRQFISDLAKATGLQWSDGEPRHDQGSSFGAEDIFNYLFGVLHSPTYRELFADELLRDFPPIPLPWSADLFRALARLGGELVALHLLESPKLDKYITTYTGPAKPEVVRVGWADNTVWLDAAATKKGQSATPGTIGFHGVPEAVWNFHIGGYQVCEKWLKDRGPKKGNPGRILMPEDIEHYQRIVVALKETIRLMEEIDEVIEAYGGWPIE